MDRKHHLVKKGIAIADLAISLGKDCSDILKSYFDNGHNVGADNVITTEEIEPFFGITAESFASLINFMTEVDNLFSNRPVTQGDWLSVLNKVRSNY